MLGTTIDLWSSASFANGQPVEQYRWLRKNDPVHWHDEPEGPGFWAVTRYEELRTVSRDTETFTSTYGQMMSGQDLLRPPTHMMNLDPPLHTRYRLLVNKAFLPRSAKQLEPSIRALAGRIVDEISGAGECDFMTDIAGKLPSYVIAELLGIPLEDGVYLYQLTEKMHSAEDAVSREGRIAAAQEMREYGGRVFRAKSENPGDDLATVLVQSEIDGDRLGELDFAMFFLLLINAGGDTTRNLVGGAMHTLFQHEGERERLQSNLEALLPSAVEEFLRFLSPVIYQRRTATRDTRLGDKQLRAGDKVIMYYGSANRDETVFDDPDRFDVGRSPNEHVAFGAGGVHFCLGAHIARIEVQAMLREVLTRLPDIQPAGSPEWIPSNFISGPSKLPVRFKARPQ